ncbi:MAG: hypothetical protein V2B18_15155, partial [Pseudomonadota bacterium]
MHPIIQVLVERRPDLFDSGTLRLPAHVLLPDEDQAVMLVDAASAVLFADASAISLLGLPQDPAGHPLSDAVANPEDLFAACLSGSRRALSLRFRTGPAKTVFLRCWDLTEFQAKLFLLWEFRHSGPEFIRGRALDRVAASLSTARLLGHRIRNPLAGLFAGLEVLEQEPSLNEEAVSIVGMLLDEVRAVDDIIRRTTDSLSWDVRDARPLSGKTLLKEVMSRSAPAADAKRIVMEQVDGTGKTIITADRRAIATALGSVLRAAVDAVRPGGTIRAGWREISAEERENLFPGYCHRVLSFSVTGSEAAEEPNTDSPTRMHFPDAVEMFETDLRLFVAGEIIELHGGVFPRKAGETRSQRFEVFLPAAPTRKSRRDLDDEESINREAARKCSVDEDRVGMLCWALGRGARTGEIETVSDMCRGCAVFHERAIGPFFRP